MGNSNVYFTVPVPQPCWGYLRVGRTIYEVEITEIHNEPDGVIKNTVVLPDGRAMKVDNRKIKHRRPRRLPFVANPNRPVQGPGSY